ncbi:MAG: BadF/BadG/BcrA/BcrD ATPase family protein [Thermomicrobiales bacterium]
MSFVLGVDGGASKTIALLATSDGEIVGSSRRAGSSIYEGDPGEMLANAVDACRDAMVMAGISEVEIAASVFSMAGADWPEDFALIQSELRDKGLGRRITVVNDAVGGLRTGSSTGPAVAVICGTGAGTAARNAEGQIWHSSFWQGGGGAVDLTNEALRAVYRAESGIDSPTMLTSAVLAFTGFDHVEPLLHHLTARGGVPSSRYAGLARVLLDIASAGDPKAREIVASFGALLGEDAVTASRQVDIDQMSFELVLGGSVFKHPEPLLADSLVTRVREHCPAFTLIRNPFEPVVGALLLAFDEAEKGPGSGIAAAVEASWRHHRDSVLAIPDTSGDSVATGA